MYNIYIELQILLKTKEATWIMGYIIFGVVVVIIFYFIMVYNNLVAIKNRAENGWASIDTQLQRRFDLIPNLVETVKGYAAHEKDVLENITRARSGMMSAQTVSEKAEADNALTGTLKTLFAVAEAYPDLKANQNFLQLQVDLKGTEDKIAFSRQFYNDTVARLNTEIQKFPQNIIAGIAGFKERQYFEIQNEQAKQNVQVKF